MPTNGAYGPVAHSAVRFGDFVGDLPAWLEPEPETRHTIVEIEHGRDFESSQFIILEGDRTIVRGDGAAIAAQMRTREQATPGALTTLRFADGRSVVFQNRTPDEVRAGKPACVWRSDRPAETTEQ